MPVSHIGLTVSHLPRSCSFYLSALQPLGYRYIGQQDNQIGFGEKEADFFICQDSPGTKPGPAHIAFAANSRDEVESFFSAAIKAGGLVHGEPRQRDSNGYFSAAVIDFDDNAVEVVHRDSEKAMSTYSGDHYSRIIEQEPRSTFERSPLRSIVNNITTTVTSTTSQPTPPPKAENSDSRTLVGTLLGAAAGAAIAYCLTREETTVDPSGQDPTIYRRTTVRHTIEGSPTRYLPQSVHKGDSVSYASEVSSDRTVGQRAIEPPRSVVSDARSKTSHKSIQRALEAAPSVVSEARSKASHKSVQRTLEAAPTVVSDAQTKTTHKSAQRVIEAPPTVVSEARSKSSRHSSKPLAIEAAPTMISAASTRKSRRASPPAPTFYTVQEPSELQAPEVVLPPSSSHVTKASHASRASKAPSIRTVESVRTVKTAHSEKQPSHVSKKTSTHPRDPRDTALPESRYSIHTVYTKDPRDIALPESTRNSTHTRDPRDIVLPVSVKSSTYTQDPRDIALPISTKNSSYTIDPHYVALPASSHHNHTTPRHSSHHRDASPLVKILREERNPWDYPLPASDKTSFLSRARSPPRSAASASTVKPLTMHNIRRAATENGVDDLETVVPEDSISQAGSKPKSHRHHRRRSESGRSGTSRSGRKASSRVSMPRSIGRALGVTA